MRSPESSLRDLQNCSVLSKLLPKTKVTTIQVKLLLFALKEAKGINKALIEVEQVANSGL
jgi:hypothetical protein